MHTRIGRLKHSVLAGWKFLLSLHKRDWELRDYPIVLRSQNVPPDADSTSSRLRPYRYVAQILNWSLVGGGDTPEDALRELAVNFEKAAAERRQQGTRLPRPGTTVPVQFASRERIHAHEELADDFVRRVLGLDWAWISDESSLWHFHGDDSNETLHAKIRDVYGVDVSDVESGNLVEILDRIAANTL